MNTNTPLPGGPRPLPYHVQARGCVNAMVVLALAGLAALPFGPVGLGIGIGLGILALTAGLIGLGVFLLSRNWRGQLRRMEAGDYLLHWQYSPTEWAPFRARMVQENRRIHWIIPLCLAGSGLVFAMLLHGDGDLIGGSLMLNYLIPMSCGAALGWLLAQAIGWMNGTSLRLMDREPPEAVIGADGLYITGQYWPWQTFGQRLTHVSLGADEPPTLDFHFHVMAGRVMTTKVVAVPIPANARSQAEQLVAHLARETA